MKPQNKMCYKNVVPTPTNVVTTSTRVEKMSGYWEFR